MADNETIADIIAEARDKYTVHNCNECEYRKSCDLNAYGFDSDECRGMRQSIMLVFGIEDGYFTKLLDRLEAAHKRERGDCAKMREALKSLMDNLQIHAMMPCEQITMNRAEVCAMIEDCRAALAEPVKNCEVGTPEEQSARFAEFCHANINAQRCCGDCPAFRGTRDDCELVWAQMPYKEGGAK